MLLSFSLLLSPLFFCYLQTYLCLSLIVNENY
ncbi:hypothetical protein CKO_02309 [Citrobacter koseri ATCC BAA-895]|uniref:Uncharacterized protein n=1 Tax=Citrobacter koseri (strain ATCC BAA-895 / CDC 4225-83 / SGSC4696) TaxID=290338 RepID=A8AIW8_CITK8|nr:hypothetical protein CKO_02309 [Citrobacter koseri ATCC BAA-895]